jgi:hypothetical protein
MSLQLEDTQMEKTNAEQALAIAEKMLSNHEHLIRLNANLETMLKEAQALLNDALATIARKDAVLADREEFMTIMSKASCTFGKSFTGEVSSYRFDLRGKSLVLFKERLKRLDLSID